jgi:hypothetical protein
MNRISDLYSSIQGVTSIYDRFLVLLGASYTTVASFMPDSASGWVTLAVGGSTILMIWQKLILGWYSTDAARDARRLRQQRQASEMVDEIHNECEGFSNAIPDPVPAKEVVDELRTVEGIVKEKTKKLSE